MNADDAGQHQNGPDIPSSTDRDLKTLALVCNPIYFDMMGQSPFWRLLADNVRLESEHRSTKLETSFSTPATTPGSEDTLDPSLLHDLSAARLDGVLTIALTQATTDAIEATGIPVVGFSCPARYRVEIDGPATLQMAVEALAAHGCRRIGFWRPRRFRLPPEAQARQVEELTGLFRSALDSVGCPFHGELVHIGVLGDGPRLFSAGETLQEQGYHTAMKTFSGPENLRPDGLFIADDLVTRGAMTAINTLGGTAANRVTVASLANKGSNVLAEFADKIIRVEVDPAEIVQQMFVMLETLLYGATPPTPHTLVPPRLIPDNQ